MQIKSASFFQKFNCTTYVTFLSTSKIPQTKAMLKIFSLKSYILGGGGLRAPETMSPLGVIKPKAMKNNKGREGGHKFGKLGRRRLWMAPYLIDTG